MVKRLNGVRDCPGCKSVVNPFVVKESFKAVDSPDVRLTTFECPSCRYVWTEPDAKNST